MTGRRERVRSRLRSRNCAASSASTPTPATRGAWNTWSATCCARAHYTIAAAESCTGGLLTSRLTDVPGSSAYVERAVVVYSNAAKTELLGVAAALIAEHGAVSEPVAIAMATGVRERAGTAIGVGITGIAGPDGGTAEKPVGTVAIAVSGPWGTSARTRVFPGGREQVKFFATQAALDDLRRALLRERG